MAAVDRGEAASPGIDPVVLAVGDVAGWNRSRRPAPTGSRVIFAEFHEVTLDLIEMLSPHVVISSLLARRFDCVDLAQRLDDLGFAGRYQVLTDELPRPEMVLTEIRALFPRLQVEIDPMPRHLIA